jgi:prefoldin alpha subunit
MKSLHQKPNSDTLVPIGMGTYVQTKISSNDKIVLNIGAGIAVEKTYDSTINYLEARIKEIEVALQDTSAKKQEALARLEQGKEQMNQLMQESSQNISG